MMHYRWALAGLLCAALALPSPAQVANDVPRDHFAYAAIQDLVSKGLVKGYPPDGNFWGKRTATRYEMAALVQRVLARVDELVATKADKSEIVKPEPAPQNNGVSQDQLDEIKKLVDAFKVELVVIGTDMKKAQDDIVQLRTDLETVKTGLSDLSNKVGAHDEEIAGVKQGVQSAIDAVAEQSARVDKVNATKVDSGFGKIKVDGLLQVWFQGEKNAPLNGVVDGFRLRRAELKLSGTVNPKAYWWMMVDPAKQLSLTTTSASGNITSVAPTQSSNILQEVVVGWNLSPALALEVGQQKVPMSLEGLRSASQLLTVERSIFNTLPANNGRVGDIRDAGAMLRFTSHQADAQLGVFNDAGNRQNTLDDNNDKEVIWHANYKGFHLATLGAYGEISGGVGGVNKTQRQRTGFEGTLNLGRHKLEAEWAIAKDGSPFVRSHGGYATYAYQLSPTWEFITKGEFWNPNRDLHGAAYTCEYDWTAGLNYYLVGHNAKIQANWVRKNINGALNTAGTGPAGGSFLGLDRNLFMINFQQSY